MGASSGVRFGAFVLVMLATLVSASRSRAQESFEEASRALDFSPDPLDRSPRLLGLGRLTLVIPDPNNRVNLWDFAGNPLGILEADSASSLEFRPGTSSMSSAHSFASSSLSGERQDAAARTVRMGYEMWRRSGANAFGAIGDLPSLSWDRPFDDSREVRSRFSVPSAMPVLTGRFPFFWSEHMKYALRGVFSNEAHDDEYRAVFRNSAGQYVDHEGELLGTPNFFDPDERDVNRSGVGAGLSYSFSSWLTVAAGGDFVRDRIKSKNEAGRYLSQRDETRPFGIGQLSLEGRLGGSVEYAADSRTWNSSSDAQWVFTLSQGPGARPILGRGDLYDREETGSSSRARIRWHAERLELGASFGRSSGEYEIIPPPVSDQASYNNFLNQLFTFTLSDSLILPDSIRANRVERTASNYAAGASWRLPNRRGIFGVEYHWMTDLSESDLGGTAAERVAWDVRSGLEYVFTHVLVGRAGYIYRFDDRDEATEQNEFVSHAVTAGFGLRHPGSSWGLEAGYAFEWGQADFGTPAQPRSTRQQLAAGLHWSF